MKAVMPTLVTFGLISAGLNVAFLLFDVQTVRAEDPYTVYLYPNGDSAVEWDTVFPSGDHYAQVDDHPHDSSTTYVSTDTNSDEDHFDMGDMSEPGSGYVINVTVFAVHQKLASQPCAFQAGIRISTTNYLTIDVAPTNGEWVNSSGTTWETNPSTSSAWTYAEVNALLCVITTNDASPTVFCTQVGLKVQVSFAPSNNPPYFTSTPAATGHNNTLYYYDANAEDDDEDPLTFDLEGNITGWASITPSTGVVQGTPTEIGDYWMNVSVTDGTDTVWQNTSVHIYTDAPSFISSPITTWPNGTTYQYNAQATDPEAEGLTFDLEGNGTSFVGITPAGYFCLLEGAITEMGWWYLNISVSDGVNTVWQNYSMNATNDAPYFTSSPVTECLVNESYIYDVEATDNNSDVLTFSIDASPSETKIWLSYNISSGQLEGVPTINGSYDVNLSVTDVLGATQWQNFTITVDLNDADTVSVLMLVISLAFCFGLMYAGFKEHWLEFAAGICWIVCGVVVFIDYSTLFMGLGIGIGAGLMLKGAYDVGR